MRRLFLLAAAVLASLTAAGSTARAERTPLQVLTTTTDLRELVREVGGGDTAVACLMKGPEDTHFLEARPSFVRLAAKADALVVTGMELEIGYEPILLSDSRNAKIQKGRPGYVDCSAGIGALEVPQGPVDRSHGDVHAAGNPHYLLDPVRAKIAAATIADRLAEIDPEGAAAYRKRLDAFRRKVDVAMFGEALLAAQPVERLERRLADGTLGAFLKERQLAEKVAGFAAELLPHAGRKVASYHANAVYLCDRFHLTDADKLEPKPGVPPSPRHLADVVARMRSGDVRAVLYTVYQPAETARSVAEQAGAAAVLIAHQPDAVAGTATYLDMVAHNVRALAAALAAKERAR
jgi:ABC-type Zn uptake system ZnuABC Zn-binding protein ZnuA